MSAAAIAAHAPACDWWSLRTVERRNLSLTVRNDVAEPPRLARERGAMVTVRRGAGEGYAATSDLAAAGLRAAFARAAAWADRAAACGLVDARRMPRPARSLERSAGIADSWTARAPSELLPALVDACRRLARGEAIVDRSAGLGAESTQTTLVTADGVEIRQASEWLVPMLSATASRAGESQTRSLGFDGARSGGVGLVPPWLAAAERIGDEALALLAAPDTPSGAMHLLLAPSQMALQIHESIGHPLELDRILGDERNYAGGSFVTPAMVGSYRYGSDLLTVTFDPDLPGEAAGYAADDDGTPARREVLIDRGILVRVLGGAASQARSGVPGVANARACAWSRPAIDRMANLNVEPGASTFADLVAGIERGVWMDTNRSWSIDDSRDKFQFGCEFAREIVDGRLGRVLRNPNYRGRSSAFWRSLDGVGDASTFAVHGVPSCGKGEPNQVICVGHAAPACRFAAVEVFGGRG